MHRKTKSNHSSIGRLVPKQVEDGGPCRESVLETWDCVCEVLELNSIGVAFSY